jgi:hypothetical protein
LDFCIELQELINYIYAPYVSIIKKALLEPAGALGALGDRFKK